MQQREIFSWAVVLLLAGTGATSAAECGFRLATFTSGFEPSEYGSLELSPADTAPVLNVLQPVDGSIVASDTLQILGSYQGPPNSGIAVNDSPARSVAGQWLHTVKLNPGANDITVTLSTQAGSTTTVMRNVTYDPMLAPEVSLQLLNGPERAPLDAAFNLQLKPGSLLHIVGMQIDYDSDGTVDLDSANPASSLTHRYLQPGIYTATAAVTLDDDVSATPAVLVNTDIKVLVEHPDEYRLTLCAVFDGMRSALMADDITTALTALHPSVRTSW